ncbi:MAG: CNP1-like family protein [Chromatiales bacterium]|nr:CNP1-like family protein [Chromatiales bacterium]
MTLKPVWLLLIAAIITPPTLARDILLDDPLDDEYDAPEKSDWLEGEVQVPGRIDRDDLEEFEVAANETRFRYFVERNSIQHDRDGAVRFTLVIRSNSGAANSSYEGFRCRERLYKVYAYGGDERLTPVPGTDWEPIPKDESIDYRATLYDDLLCNLQLGEPNPVEKVIEAMRNNRKVGRD